MKIIFFTNNYFPRQSGVAFSIGSLKKSLESLGHQVYIVAPQYSKIKEKNEKRIFRVKSIIIPSEKYFSVPLPFLASKEIFQYIKKIRPHLIHVHHPFLLGKEGQKAARLLKIPCVFTYHSLYEYYTHYIPIIGNLSRLVVQKICFDFTNKCDQIIAPTREIRRYLKRNQITVPIVVIPTGINLARFRKKYTIQKLTQIKKKFGIPLNNQVILHVGRIVKEKNIDVILKSFQVLIQKKSDTTLLMVGYGHHLNYYKKIAQKIGIQNKVIWTDFIPRDQLPPLYKLANVFIFTSQCDTQAIVLYESLAAGIPIIATKSLASLEIINNKRNGILVDNNPNAIGKTILECLHQKQPIKIVLPQEKYSEKAVAQKTANIYKQLI